MLNKSAMYVNQLISQAQKDYVLYQKVNVMTPIAMYVIKNLLQAENKYVMYVKKDINKMQKENV